MTPDRIKELRAVIAKATPGPLVFNSRKEIGYISSDDTDQTFGMLIPIADALSLDDAEAIVSSCNDLPAALDTIESQAARIAELEAAVNPFVPGYASWMDQFADGDLCGFARPVTFGHIRAARDALTKGE